MFNLYPNPFFASNPEKHSLIAYANGPTGAAATSEGVQTFGASLIPNTSLDGRWAQIFYNGSITLGTLENENSPVDPINFTGYNLDSMHGNVIDLNAPDNYSNLSIAFDSSGRLFTCIQENGVNNSINPPLIHIIYSGGAATYSFTGYNPMLFSQVLTNFPNKTGVTTGVFHTGHVLCYYFNNDGSILYYRYAQDNFTNAYISNSGLSAFNGNVYRIEKNIFNLYERPPYQYLMYVLSSDGRRLKMLKNKEYISFGAEDFEQSPTGESYFFPYGYNLKVTGIVGGTLGRSLSASALFSDNFEAYSSGASVSEYASNVFMENFRAYTGLSTGRLSFYQEYKFDNFENYPTGSISILASGSGVLNRTIFQLTDQGRILPSGI